MTEQGEPGGSITELANLPPEEWERLRPVRPNPWWVTYTLTSAAWDDRLTTPRRDVPIRTITGIDPVARAITITTHNGIPEGTAYIFSGNAVYKIANLTPTPKQRKPAFIPTPRLDGRR